MTNKVEAPPSTAAAGTVRTLVPQSALPRAAPPNPRAAPPSTRSRCGYGCNCGGCGGCSGSGGGTVPQRLQLRLGLLCCCGGGSGGAVAAAAAAEPPAAARVAPLTPEINPASDRSPPLHRPPPCLLRSSTPTQFAAAADVVTSNKTELRGAKTDLGIKTNLEARGAGARAKNRGRATSSPDLLALIPVFSSRPVSFLGSAPRTLLLARRRALRPHARQEPRDWAASPLLRVVRYSRDHWCLPLKCSWSPRVNSSTTTWLEQTTDGPALGHAGAGGAITGVDGERTIQSNGATTAAPR